MPHKLFKRGEVWWCRVRDASGNWVKVTTRCYDYQAALAEAAAIETTPPLAPPLHV